MSSRSKWMWIGLVVVVVVFATGVVRLDFFNTRTDSETTHASRTELVSFRPERVHVEMKDADDQRDLSEALASRRFWRGAEIRSDDPSRLPTDARLVVEIAAAESSWWLVHGTRMLELRYEASTCGDDPKIVADGRATVTSTAKGLFTPWGHEKDLWKDVADSLAKQFERRR